MCVWEGQGGGCNPAKPCLSPPCLTHAPGSQPPTVPHSCCYKPHSLLQNGGHSGRSRSGQLAPAEGPQDGRISFLLPLDAHLSAHIQGQVKAAGRIVMWQQSSNWAPEVSIPGAHGLNQVRPLMWAFLSLVSTSRGHPHAVLPPPPPFCWDWSSHRTGYSPGDMPRRSHRPVKNNL